ncbi:aldehyde dehydrogenase family protein [Timonella sp. A28]|uniref:aldehyde dehydrogenase family protein n=1 Tax=Timonella sp. A28 TaxID=3442640 RepID=UPI003EBCE819
MDLVKQHVTRAREAFDEGITKPRTWRLEQLRALDALLRENENLIAHALKEDLGKHPTETFLTETSLVRAEIKHTIKHLKRWLAPSYVKPSLAVAPATAYTVLEPLGVVLIIAPWNYPLQLVLAPLVGALAAGNAAVIKPSELAPETSRLLASLIPAYLDERAVKVVEGGVPETTALLEQKFDHIFYTGNARVARIVMAAAARNLTPVTLELGGKSPVYVDGSVDVKVTAQRIVWGKFINAGQTCVAPDYVLVSQDVEAELVEQLIAAVQDLYGHDIEHNTHYGRLINDAHFDRIVGLMGPENGRIVVGGEHNKTHKYVGPTVLVDVPHTAPLMSEEIFGPLLPVLPVADEDEAISIITSKEKPLSLYVFSEQKHVRKKFLQDTSSGAVTFGLPIAHLAIPDLPFGGVGESGVGAYHGKRSIEVFSHEKAVVSKPLSPDTLALVYPPFHPKKLGIVRKLLG